MRLQWRSGPLVSVPAVTCSACAHVPLCASCRGTHKPRPAPSCLSPNECADGAQCRLANDFAFGQVFCFEPSPINYERARDALALTGTLTSGRLMLEQLAVSNSSGGTIEFHSVGGTGDHAGALLEGEHASYRAPGATISVPTVTLDAYFQNSSASIYIGRQLAVWLQRCSGGSVLGARQLNAARASPPLPPCSQDRCAGV